MLDGIDVASYQDTSYATGNIDFVVVKATEGTSYVNPKMVAQAAHGRAAGLVVGFYHFLHAGRVAEQVAYFLGHTPMHTGDFLVCDWESVRGEHSATNADKDDFLRRLKQARPHARVMLYCNTDFWLHHDTTSDCGDGLWIADPNRPAGHPGIKHGWVIHQWGESGGTDRNVANFASRAAMGAWTGHVAPPPARKPPTPVMSAPAPAVPAGETLENRVAALEGEVAALRKKVGI